MARYLSGSFYVDGKTMTGCVAYVTKIGDPADGMYPIGINIYSDATRTTSVYSRSDISLPVMDENETDDSKELRALTNFKMLAPLMTISEVLI